MAYIRKFKMTSGATGVQVCYKEGNRVVRTVHIGSAQTPEGIEKLVREGKRLIEKEQGTKPLFNLSKFEN